MTQKRMFGKRKTVGRLLAALCMGACFMQAYAQREVKTVNDGWKFMKGDKFVTNAMYVPGKPFDDSGWESVHIPHTWNTDAYTVKDYYRGIGWYRKQLTVPEHWNGKRVFLKMEAASKAATVYVNGKEVGSHAGGYTAFTIDITPYVSFDKANDIAIQVDNSRQDIAPISGDFTFFGGIYRDVWLVAVSAQHFNMLDYGSDGVFIDTPQVSEEQATVSVRGGITNDAKEKADVELVTSLYSPDGSLLQTQRKTVSLKAGGMSSFSQAMKPVKSPLLWTPETPNLYRVETTIIDKKTKKVLDQTEHNTAFRWYSFDGDKGFFLNGKPYKLRGVCRHQDQKPVGVALTDEMHRRDMLMMKDMGANFIRVSHYPQDEAILEMCDKLGMLAWEEIPIIDIVRDTPGYADNCEHNLREMIRQHYNHPSIIMWGYMNEILLVTQRTYKTDEEMQPALERTLALAKRLESVLKQEDHNRLSTMAFHGSDSYNGVGLSGITDVVGWNLYNGWYGGDLTGFERFLAEQHDKYPAHPMIVSEYGAGSDKRLHSFSPKPFDFSIEYQQKYLEHYLPVLENTPYVCGGSHWNFIDFSSALRDESMPRINNKGLVCADRTPKDVYYYYKAAWRDDSPVLHIATRDWTHRYGVRNGNDAVEQPVKVYTNLPEVELFADGKSLGRQKVENCNAVFNVPFQDGETVLTAQGEYNGNAVHDGIKVTFNSVPANLTEGLHGAELAINVGSKCYYTSSESGMTWVPDQAYTPGNWGYIGGEARDTQTEIHGTADGPLLQTLRYGIEGYRFDVPKGVYEVELLFTDIFRQHAQAAYLLGKEGGQAEQESAFGISVNGNTIEDNVSPCNESGYFQTVRRKYIVTNDTGHLDIQFNSIGGKCFLNAMKLRSVY